MKIIFFPPLDTCFLPAKLASLSSGGCTCHLPTPEVSRLSKYVGSLDYTGAPVGGGETLNPPNSGAVRGFSCRRVPEGHGREEGAWDQIILLGPLDGGSRKEDHIEISDLSLCSWLFAKLFIGVPPCLAWLCHSLHPEVGVYFPSSCLWVSLICFDQYNVAEMQCVLSGPKTSRGFVVSSPFLEPKNSHLKGSGETPCGWKTTSRREGPSWQATVHARQVSEAIMDHPIHLSQRLPSGIFWAGLFCCSRLYGKHGEKRVSQAMRQEDKNEGKREGYWPLRRTSVLPFWEVFIVPCQWKILWRDD